MPSSDRVTPRAGRDRIRMNGRITATPTRRLRMRRTTTALTATTAIAAALTFGTAFATTQTSSPTGAPTAEPTETSAPVTNTNGHEVNEHAAHGQARAAEVHQRNAAKHAAKHPVKHP